MKTADEFWATADKTSSPDGCWLWKGTVDRAGYGHVSWRGRGNGVHRVAHELAIGPIPVGLTIDHVWDRGCRNRHCVNPAHLEAVTIGENARRGKTARKTHCVNNHPFDAENTYRRPDGTRECRACARRAVRAWRARQREVFGQAA